MKHKRSLMSIAMATIMVVSLCAVCASTSVGAAPNSSKASAQATPDLVGSPIATGTGPAACVLTGSTMMYVFVKGYDGALWYRIWSTVHYFWVGGWISLGGQLTSSPAAVSRDVGILDVYVTGTNGNIYERAYYGGTWHEWYNIGGKVAPGTGPGASAWTGRDDVFVQGTNGALYQKTWSDSTGWSGWTSLGGQLTSSPAAVSRYSDDILVFVRGTNGAVYARVYYYGWFGWESLGGQVAPGTGPGASGWPGRVDIFVEGTNGALYQKTYAFDSGWSGWASLGGKLSASPTAATFTYAGTINIEVFVRGTNGNIYYKTYANGAWFVLWSGPWQGPP